MLRIRYPTCWTVRGVVRRVCLAAARRRPRLLTESLELLPQAFAASTKISGRQPDGCVHVAAQHNATVGPLPARCRTATRETTVCHDRSGARSLWRFLPDDDTSVPVDLEHPDRRLVHQERSPRRGQGDRNTQQGRLFGHSGCCDPPSLHVHTAFEKEAAFLSLPFLVLSCPITIPHSPLSSFVVLLRFSRPDVLSADFLLSSSRLPPLSLLRFLSFPCCAV